MQSGINGQAQNLKTKKFKFQYFPVYEARNEKMPYFSEFKRKFLERSIMVFCITSFCGFNYFALIEKPLDALVCSVLSMILTGQYYAYMNIFGIQISKIELVRMVADGQPLDWIFHVKITSQTGEWCIVEIDKLRPLSSRKDNFLRN